MPRSVMCPKLRYMELIMIRHFCDRLSSTLSSMYVRSSCVCAFSSNNTFTITKGNALLRIGHVLRFSPVAINVGAGSATLSYQKGYFPIIEVRSK
jgi:hypothetical protein